MDTIQVVIQKPLFGSYVYVRDIYLKQAIAEHKNLSIIIPSQGQFEHDPRAWIKTGKRMEKVFKIKNRPMVLYGNYADNKPVATSKETHKDKEAETQMSLL